MEKEVRKMKCNSDMSLIQFKKISMVLSGGFGGDDANNVASAGGWKG